MRALITAEFLRLRATRLWLWALLAAIALGAGLVGLIGVTGPQNAEPPMPGLSEPAGVSVVLGLFAITVFCPAIFGTAAMTSEFRHRTVVTTFLFAPRRWQVLAAKLVVFAAGGVAYGGISSAAALGALYLSAWLTGTTVGVPLSSVLLILLQITLAMAVYCLIGVGVGALVRNQMIAMVIVIGYFYFAETMLMLIPGVNLLYPFLPGGATAALTSFTFLTDSVSSEMGTQAVTLLPPALGAVVLLAYAAAAATTAVALPLRRDV